MLLQLWSEFTQILIFPKAWDLDYVQWNQCVLTAAIFLIALFVNDWKNALW